MLPRRKSLLRDHFVFAFPQESMHIFSYAGFGFQKLSMTVDILMKYSLSIVMSVYTVNVLMIFVLSTIRSDYTVDVLLNFSLSTVIRFNYIEQHLKNRLTFYSRQASGMRTAEYDYSDFYFVRSSPCLILSANSSIFFRRWLTPDLEILPLLTSSPSSFRETSSCSFLRRAISCSFSGS